MKEETKLQFSPRPFSRLVTVCACLATAMTFVAFNSVAQASFLEFSASAYGSYAFVGSTVVVGKTAPVAVGPGCGTAQTGLTVTGTGLSVNALPIIQTGAINTSAASTTNSATATSDVHDIFLLGATQLTALITADEVKAVSTTSHDSTGFHVSATGSNLVNLKVLGMSISATTAPNTTILLPGIGKVVINEQIVSGGTNMKGLTVNMIHVYVTVANTLGGGSGIPVGTQIIVAHAVSHLAQIGGPGSLDGTAFGTSVSSKTIKSSPTVPASVGCQGNALITNTQLGINVPNVLSSGTITDTAQGSVTASLSSSETTSTVQNVNLLSGIVTASAVHADAKATTTPPGTTFNFSEGSGSYFTSLVVQGVAYANVAANTKLTITVNGTTLGTLYLHRVIKGTNSITVRMIELVIAAGNPLGLPAGMDIIVASASASLHSPAHP